MADTDFSRIAQYFATPQTPTSNANDIAKFILLNAEVNRTSSTTAAKNGPSIMSRIFDILSRPRYAVANTVRAISKGDTNFVDDFISGLAGTQKTSFTDLLKEAGAGPTASSILGLGLDIVADPVNYIPVAGAVSKIKNLRQGVKVAPEVSNLQRQISKGQPVNPELFNLPSSKASEIPAVFKSSKATTPLRFPTDTLKSVAPAVNSVKQPVEQLALDLPGVVNRPSVASLIPEVTNSVQKATTSPGQLSFRLGSKQQKVPAVKQISPVTNTGREFEPRHAAMADKLLAKFDPARSTAQINKKYVDTLNAKQQVWLYHRAINEAKQIAKKPEWIASHAHKIYAAMESSLRAKGYVPRLGSGENVSIYDVIRQMGGPYQAKLVLDNFAKDLLPNNPIWDAVQGLKVANAIDESKSVKFILDKAVEAKTTLESSAALSDAGNKKATDAIIRLARQAAKVAPVSPASENATKKLLNQVLQGGRSPGQVAIDAKSKIIQDIISTGKGSRTELNGAVTRELEKDLGKLPSWAIDKNNASEFFMARVATWWGQKDLRPLSLNAIGAASATAAARGKALNSLFKGYSLPQRQEAVAVIQGFRPATSPDVARLADELSKMMENLVGQAVGTSVVTRSAVDMDLLNKWMRSYGTGFTFTRSSSIKDITGQTHDFSKGTDWLNSWKIAEIKGDPEAWLFRIQQSIEQATREKALFDELGERFGQKIPGGGFRNNIKGHPYLEGYYFSDDIAKQIPRVIKDWTTPLSSTDPLFKHYDRLLSMWKSGVTIYRPAHHIRNLVGDAYLGWMDGVNSIRPYTLAARVQRTLKGMYPALSDVDKLVELGVVSRAMGTPRQGEILFRNKSGVPFTSEQIAAVAHQKGLLEHARTIEDIIDLGESSRFQPFGGKVQQLGRSASELISHNTRLAHFIDKIIKSKGSNLEDIFEQASRRARKWHPTGLDLTSFERKFMRRIMPFYSWMRKSTPLLIEGLAMKPGKALVAPKIYAAIQSMQGIETGGFDDPFPVDQMFPEWLRAEGLGPLSGPQGWLGSVSNQQPPGYVMAGQGLNPLTQLVAQASNPGRMLLGSLTPAIGVPVTLASGRNLSTGEPINGIDARPGAMEEYVGSQIPIWSMVQGVTGITPFGTETKRSSQGNPATEAIINWLTGAGIKGTGPYVDQARYEKSRPAQVERKAARERFLEQLREMGAQ